MEGTFALLLKLMKTLYALIYSVCVGTLKIQRMRIIQPSLSAILPIFNNDN